MSTSTSSHVAGGASTLSKYPDLHPTNWPQVDGASGAECWSSLRPAERYVDWTSSLLANVLGYAHPEVTEAVRTHLLTGGPSWPTVHPLEESVAATVLRLSDFGPTGAVRFFKTGSEAMSAAVRVARAVTGRPYVLKCGYSGWHDWSIAQTPPAWGVPKRVRALTKVFRYNDLEAIREQIALDGTRVAAVVVEPVTGQEPMPGFLLELESLAAKCGAVLVFDESITAGRYPKWTAARHYGSRPGLLVAAKGLGNGFPLAALVGTGALMACFAATWAPSGTKEEIGPVYASGTFSGSTDGLVAAQATLAVWERECVAEHLWATGARLRVALLGALAASSVTNVQISGTLYRLILDLQSSHGRTEYAALTFLRQELAREGHLIGSGWNISFAHTPAHVEQMASAFSLALERLYLAQENHSILRAIHGRVVLPPYRQA